MVRPFPFFGHGLGAPSRDFDFSVVFVGEPTAAAKKRAGAVLAPYGKPTWLGPFANWLVGSRALAAGLRTDPSFVDDPSRLGAPGRLEAFGLAGGGALEPLRDRLLCYAYERDLALGRLHEEHALALAVGVPGARAQLTDWHRQSMSGLGPALDLLMAVHRGPAMQALIDVRHYRRRNYYTSPAKVVLDVLAVALPNARAWEGLADAERSQLAGVAEAALGLSAITDHRLMSYRAHLLGLSMEVQVEALPEPLRPKLRLLGGWETPVALW